MPQTHTVSPVLWLILSGCEQCQKTAVRTLKEPACFDFAEVCTSTVDAFAYITIASSDASVYRNICELWDMYSCIHEYAFYMSAHTPTHVVCEKCIDIHSHGYLCTHTYTYTKLLTFIVVCLVGSKARLSGFLIGREVQGGGHS